MQVNSESHTILENSNDRFLRRGLIQLPTTREGHVEKMWTPFEPVLASQAFSIGRLWIVSLVLAVGGPPAIAWLRQRHWRFTVRTVFIVVLVVSACFAWVASELADLLCYFRDPYAILVDCDYSVPLLLVVISALATWLICRSGPEHS